MSPTQKHDAHYRHATYYAQLLSQLDERYVAGNISSALFQFDANWLQIELGHSWSLKNSRRYHDALELLNLYPDKGARLLDLRHPRQERARWLEIALKASVNLNDSHAQTVHLGNLSITYRRLGKIQQALQYAQLALELSQKLGDKRGEANDLVNLANCYFEMGNLEQALCLYEDAYALAKQHDDKRTLGTRLGNIGSVYFGLGQYKRAIDAFEQACAGYLRRPDQNLPSGSPLVVMV